MNSRSLLSLLLLFGLLFFNHVATGGAENKVYRIGTVTWAGWSPLQVADVKGFWRDLSIQVKPAIYDDPMVILEAIKAGRIDFAMDMVGSLVGIYMQGESVVLLAETNWSDGGDEIIVQHDISIPELKGQPFGVFLKLPSCLYFLNQYLKTVDLQISDFRIVELKPDDLSEQFIAGRLPAILNYAPYTLKAVREGNGKVLADSSMYEGCIPEGLFTYRERLKEIPASDINKILRGWIRAAKWIKRKENWNEFRQILNEQTFATHPPYSESELRSFIDAVKIHDFQALIERNRSHGGLANYMTDMRRFLAKNQMLTTDFSISDIFENQYILEALDLEKAASAGQAK
ncbi:hypothetical protein GF373_01840 [bacterium]|nr:hypothetical protein [bacterium]